MTTEPERQADQKMREQTAYTHSTEREGKDKLRNEATMQPSDERRDGTRVLPMPADDKVVAGMPREQRVHTEPGDPGHVAPEEQLVGTEKKKTSG